MIRTTVSRGSRLSLAMALLVFSVTAARAQIPQGEFACQVQTAGGQSGLVLIQANSREEAVKLSLSMPAKEMGGATNRAISVVECITARGEDFKDSWFNRFYKKLPM